MKKKEKMTRYTLIIAYEQEGDTIHCRLRDGTPDGDVLMEVGSIHAAVRLNDPDLFDRWVSVFDDLGPRLIEAEGGRVLGSTTLTNGEHN